MKPIKTIKAWVIYNSSKVIHRDRDWAIQLFSSRADAEKKITEGQTVEHIEIKMMPRKSKTR